MALTIAVLLLLACYKFAGGTVSGWLGWIVLFSVTASTLTLSVITFRATQIYQLSPTTFNVVGSLVTVLLVFIASIYSDAHLAQSIGITGAELPAAQRAVTIMLSLVVWAVVFTVVALILYLITALVWMVHSASSADARQKRLSFLMFGGGQRHETKNKEGIYLTLFIGLAFTALIPLNAVQQVAKEKRLERWANNLTVFASFHLGEHPCFPEVQAGTRLGLIDSERVIAATPDTQLGYTYELRRCQTTAVQ
ncbi:hypothetical protein [Phytopseudomonas daroniae]|uniref:hypothetical protein n=1 Tax=Phytopseudomonas daroniae TaxID=2487519 RepID=UPI00103835B7|nr:hypothetical protein [Pseudomonas daroniae]